VAAPNEDLLALCLQRGPELAASKHFGDLIKALSRAAREIVPTAACHLFALEIVIFDGTALFH
jgi:hypothetical protein